MPHQEARQRPYSAIAIAADPGKIAIRDLFVCFKKEIEPDRSRGRGATRECKS
jgi:hypothetical protein